MYSGSDGLGAVGDDGLGVYSGGDGLGVYSGGDGLGAVGDEFGGLTA